MFGLFIGVASLVGLMWVLKGGRRGWGPGCGPPRHHHHHRWGRRGRGHGPGGLLFGLGGPWLAYVRRRLETTPSQDRAIREAVREFTDELRGLRREVRAYREDVATSVRGDTLDETVLGELFGRQDDRIREVRKAFVGMLGRIHAVLDDEQRRRLGAMIEGAPLIDDEPPFEGPPGGDGPYRDWV
ncbi:MAG: Spy/CpxP family protein refolding chaperone [Sandaracinaceae bacterium]